MKSVIYKIVNTITNDFYIGSSVSFSRRKRKHLYTLAKREGVNRILQNAWDKYSEENFRFEVIEEVFDVTTLLEREQYYLDTLRPKYNVCPNSRNHLGARYRLKKPRSKEHSEKIGAAAKLRLSDPTKNPMYGKKHNEVSIALMKQNRGSIEGKNNPFYGKKHSKHTLDLMSLAKKGKRSSRARFSDDQVRQMRSLYEMHKDYEMISKQYGISISGAKKIIGKHRYADVN